MNKRLTAILVALLALMLAGIVFAVTRLYKDDEKAPELPQSSDFPLLRAVPVDAVAVFSFDGSRASRKVLSDSAAVLSAFIPKEVFPLIQENAGKPLAVSLHNSGMLVPLVAIAVSPGDSINVGKLESATRDGLLLASPSETLLGASLRHLDEGMSILGTEGILQLCAKLKSGPALFLANQQSSKLLQMFAAPRMRSYSSLLKTSSDWTGFILDADDKELSMKGFPSPAGSHQSVFSSFAALPSRTAQAPEILPFDVLSAVFLPFGDIRTYLDCRRDFEDAWGRVKSFDRDVNSSGSDALSPMEWAAGLGVSEAARVTLATASGSEEAVVLKISKEEKPSAAAPNPNRGYVRKLFGPSFPQNDSLVAVLPGKWMVFGSSTALAALEKAPSMSLKERLDDAKVRVPQGFSMYASLSDCPAFAGELLAAAPARSLERYVTGSVYAPLWASTVLSDGVRSISVSLSRRMEKGEKMATFLKDTTVIVPTGLFKVYNSDSKKDNFLYQNEHLSICLKDENGKGVWGIPFREPICGAVENIDYYQNGRTQFLFAAGSSLYLLDRLGRIVNGFPVRLPKPVRLGPKVFDLTGAGGYNVLVLHKDNSIGMYNLHGQKPSAWEGITSDEVIRSLPEMIVSGGKHYWLVPTSGGDFLYAFYGGKPLGAKESSKILKATKNL